MTAAHVLVKVCVAVTLLAAPAVGVAQTATTQAPPPSGQYEPKVGQAGKDVVWVPSPESTVEKMLDVAKVTPQDFVVDLGSGDGRNVIAAAKRGAKALGVEYNQDMVELSKRNAAAAGVSDKASFVQGDMYAAEFSQATVLALFLLPDNLLKLRDKFAALKPGTRIVANTFGIEEWTADETLTIADDCHELVHRAALFRSGARRRDLADGPGDADAQAAVSTGLRHARDGYHRERSSEGRNAELYGRRHRLYGATGGGDSRRNRQDGSRGRRVACYSSAEVTAGFRGIITGLLAGNS